MKRPLITPGMEKLMQEAMDARSEEERNEKMDQLEAVIHLEALADVYRWRWLFYLIRIAQFAFFAFILIGVVLIVWKYGYGG
jgi:hypothetical protein